ncbi:hypothetical protein F4819DRAFT_510410 [Hypoxylon fuscum]|nr:hypothetical protein F4819DRAFT_510410 [Hypoxylon fuscum]
MSLQSGQTDQLISKWMVNVNIGFRVEVHDETSPFYNSTFRLRNGSMVPRDPTLGLNRTTILNHLDWNCRDGSPFISFFTIWSRAMEWRKWLIGKGVQKVVVIAVWLDGLKVLDAYSLAFDLGFRGDMLHRHLHESLLCCVISEDSYRILAMFHGTCQTTRVSLHLPWTHFHAMIPEDFVYYSILGRRPQKIDDIGLIDATEAIANEVYNNTGERDWGTMLCALLKSIGEI